MARIDGIIILDSNGSVPQPQLVSFPDLSSSSCLSKPLITSHFSTHPPSYPSVHIDAFNHAVKKSRASDNELEPVLWVNTLSRSGGGIGMTGAGLCHVERDGLRFLVPVGHEG